MAAHVDARLRQMREQISDTDRVLVETLNKRLRLVARVKDYKDRHGVPFLDPDRETWMLAYLARANRGPLSREGLEEFFEVVLELTKREVGSPPDSLQNSRATGATGS